MQNADFTSKKAGYRNMFDAFMIHYQKPLTKAESNSTLPKSLVRLLRFYAGGSVFAVSFIVYTAIEFGLYESLMHGIETITKGQTTLINFLLRGSTMRNESCDPEHHAFGQDIVLCVLIASCCAAIVTNPLEVIFRNRQANPDWEMMKYF